MNETEKPNEQKSEPQCICGGAGASLTQMIAALIPSGEASVHFRQAHVEFLKGIRALLDQRIESMSATSQGTRINVE